MSVLVLGHDDVVRLLPYGDCIALMSEALAALAREEVHNPLRGIIRPPGASTLMGLMPAYRGGADPLYGLKAVTVAPGNPALGLDSHQGAVLLFDGVTGQLRALVDASAITAIRTAAVSALATRVLAAPGARVLAILGAGVQARSHLDAMRALQRWDEIRIWARRPGEARKLGSGIAVAASAEQAVRGAHVVCTTSSAPEPILRRCWLAPGTHVNAVGSSVPSTRELDGETMAACTLVVDRRESAEHEAGDYLLALREGAVAEGCIHAELGEVVAGLAPGRRDADEITVFKSLGLGIEDLYAAAHVVAKARAEGAGTEVAL